MQISFNLWSATWFVGGDFFEAGIWIVFIGWFLWLRILKAGGTTTKIYFFKKSAHKTGALFNSHYNVRHKNFKINFFAFLVFKIL